MWPWNKWYRFANIEEIWLDYGTDDEGESNILYLSSWVKILQRSRNKDHPWVKKVLNSMPKFCPLIVFRLCTQKCYLRVQPDLSRQQDSMP